MTTNTGQDTMTTEKPISLPAPQILEIGGADALAFAQAQFSSNLAGLANGHWQWSAWLSPQGRVRAFFHLLRDDDERVRLVLRGGSAATLRTELTRYVFRSKVSLSVVERQHACISRSPFDLGRPGQVPTGWRFACNDTATCIALPGAFPRYLLLSGDERAEADESSAAQNENALADIEAGLVTLDPTLEGRLLPTWIGLDALGATSTDKGCYPGQEIVARLHFKGATKRSLRRIAYPASTLPAPGTVRDGESGESMLIVCSAWSSAGTATSLAVGGDHATGGPR